MPDELESRHRRSPTCRRTPGIDSNHDQPMGDLMDAIYHNVADFFTGTGGWVLAGLLVLSAVGVGVSFVSRDREQEAEEQAALELLRN